jgi:tryptophan 7-halogenase
LQSNKIKNVVIAGGGTAGWVAAAALAKQLGKLINITLVESDTIGTVGVGEATIPPMRVFHSMLGVDEQEFMRATNATFKLGISFENWGENNKKYFHPFGTTGQSSFLADFQHFWLHGKSKGIDAEFGEYSFETQVAKQNKFATSKNAAINYAYHLDATRYAHFLRQFSEERGVTRIEGLIESVHQQENGDIKSIELADGLIIEGDLFIDCTGFTGLLIEKTLHTGYEDWSHWLPCDSAVAVQTESVGEPKPYTRSIAHQSGWQWQIPLQHRTGNGFVFCSKYMTDDEAKKLLLENVEGKPITQPRVLKYRTGRRKKVWNKNCVALGLSSGFVEPLESTSIYLFMNGIVRLMKLFPFDGISPSHIDEYNKQTLHEIENVRDFIILHYHVTKRDDSAFWRYCSQMEIPPSLAHRIDLFKENAAAFQGDNELFRLESWTHVMFGQGIMPKSYHKVFATMSDQELNAHLLSIRSKIIEVANKLPNHDLFIQQYCKA